MLSNGLMISLNGDDVCPGYFDDGDVFTLSASVLAGGGTVATAPPAIAVAGLYTGDVNQTYTCTVSAASDPQAIGTGEMTLTIQDSSGLTIASVNIGEGFTASTVNVTGTTITLDNGLAITLGGNGTSPGYFNDGDAFTIEALADPDTSGFLSAVGLNCFFSGIDASSIAMSDAIVESGGCIATSLSVEGTDNTNAVKIANMGEAASSMLGGLSTTDYYLSLATDVGSQVSSVQLRYNNAESVYNSLAEQRDKISGVDINDEAVRMMAYQQLFQAMSQYLSTVSESIQNLMTIIS
jgi:flagellar hook-associated protein 1 FlgK